MSVREDLVAAQAAIDQMRQRPGTHGDALRLEAVDRLKSLYRKVERMPPLGIVRTATIALNNVLVSLRAPLDGDPSVTLDDELDAAFETLQELLDDPEVGFLPGELRRRIDDALLAKGVTTCLACKNPHFEIEAGYVLIRPYPSDPGVPPSQVPSAFLVCTRCGHSWTHDLRKLGVITGGRMKTSSP